MARAFGTVPAAITASNRIGMTMESRLGVVIAFNDLEMDFTALSDALFLRAAYIAWQP